MFTLKCDHGEVLTLCLNDAYTVLNVFAVALPVLEDKQLELVLVLDSLLRMILLVLL